jgi:hypothetical protein
MSELTELLIDILKFTVPGFIVYLVVRTMLREHFANERARGAAALRQQGRETTLKLRFQAYERLTLLCQRIHISGLMLRIYQDGMTAQSLRASLFLAIQQEFEHNVTQQVYVSDQLWQIIQLARNQLIAHIDQVAEQFAAGDQAAPFKKALLVHVAGLADDPVDKALLAIKREAANYL